MCPRTFGGREEAAVPCANSIAEHTKRKRNQPHTQTQHEAIKSASCCKLQAGGAARWWGTQGALPNEIIGVQGARAIKGSMASVDVPGQARGGPTHRKERRGGAYPSPDRRTRTSGSLFVRTTVLFESKGIAAKCGHEIASQRELGLQQRAALDGLNDEHGGEANPERKKEAQQPRDAGDRAAEGGGCSGKKLLGGCGWPVPTTAAAGSGH